MSLIHSFGAFRFPVLLAVIFGIGLRIAFIVETPFNEPERVGELSAYNDEVAHVEFTRHVVYTGKLPNHVAPITSKSHVDLPTFENYQSPLFYIIHSLICKALSVRTIEGILAVGRWISVLFMLVALLIGLQLGNSLGKQYDANTHATFVVFLLLSGVFVRFSTQSGNEMLAWLIAGWFALAYVSHLARNSARNFYWLIFVFVIGLYSKLTLLVLTPLAVYAVVQTFDKDRSRATIGFVFLVAAVTPLFVYNSITFGSPLPLSAGFGEASWRVPDFSTAKYALRSAVFPWSELWQQWFGLAFFLPALLAMIMIPVGIVRKRMEQPWAAILFAFAILAYIGLNCRYDQAEARYVFIAWPAFIVGFSKLPDRIRSPWLWLVILLIPYLLFVF